MWSLASFCLFSSFQTNITIFTTNKCESIQCWDSNPWPSAHESLTLTTRPGLDFSLSCFCKSSAQCTWHNRFYFASKKLLLSSLVKRPRAYSRLTWSSLVKRPSLFQIDVEPLFVAITSGYVFAASHTSFYVWHFRTAQSWTTLRMETATSKVPFRLLR